VIRPREITSWIYVEHCRLNDGVKAGAWKGGQDCLQQRAQSDSKGRSQPRNQDTPFFTTGIGGVWQARMVLTGLRLVEEPELPGEIRVGGVGHNRI